MFILVVALAGGLLVGALLGGSFANLERLSLRLAWLVVVALLIQIVAFSPLGARLPHAAIILCTSPPTGCYWPAWRSTSVARR